MGTRRGKWKKRELDRLYITVEDAARSLYRRGKERCFTMADLRIIHMHRRGPVATNWAACMIKRWRRFGILTSYCKWPNQESKRIAYYTFTEEILRVWKLDK